MKLSRRVRLKSMKIKVKKNWTMCWLCLFGKKHLMTTPPPFNRNKCKKYNNKSAVHRHSTFGCDVSLQ